MARILTVNLGEGAVFKIDVDAELEIQDPDAERHKVASDVAWWGSIAARANARAESFANEAEHWKNAALKTIVEADDKISEWKAKASASGHADYRKMQLDVAKAQEMAGTASAIHWAFVRKMDMLNAMIKSENGTQRASSGIGVGMPREPKDPTGKTDERLKSFREKRKQEP